MEELLDLVKISRYAGQRIDLVQAGGGNGIEASTVRVGIPSRYPHTTS